MVIIIRDFVKEGPRLEDEGGKHHLGQVHARSYLLHQEPDDRFVLFAKFLCLIFSLRKYGIFEIKEMRQLIMNYKGYKQSINEKSLTVPKVSGGSST